MAATIVDCLRIRKLAQDNHKNLDCDSYMLCTLHSLQARVEPATANIKVCFVTTVVSNH